MSSIHKFVFVIFLLIPNELYADVSDSSEKSWQQFRKHYQYSYQGIAYQKLGKNEYVVIAAEPPPHVTEEDLQFLLPSISIKKHPVGYMGWSLDAVASVELSEAKFIELIQDLHTLYYDTAYKAYALDISTLTNSFNNAHHLDFEFYPGELDYWLTSTQRGKQLQFSSLTDDTLRAVEELDLNYVDVIHSQPYGLVGLWIPKNTSLSCCSAQIRQFAVDSDLIVGGTQNQNGMVLLGRARQVPFEVLPPLRAETIVQLSKVSSDELKQTINPMSLSSFVETEKDSVERWELNILSRELVDTEFGTLLTVADVFLKSWSLNGLNSVRGFRDYPTPTTWPFEEFLPKQLGVESLVFNYDSEAAGYISTTQKGFPLYSIARTGVLPLAYLPDELIVDGKMPPSVQQAELEGYKWFAKQQDPYLVRVVQYTATLQAFRACGLSVDNGSDSFIKGEQLIADYQQSIVSLVEDLVTFGEEQLQQLARDMINSAHGQVLIADAKRYYGATDSEVELLSEAFQEGLIDSLKTMQLLVHNSSTEWTERLTNDSFYTNAEFETVKNFWASNPTKAQQDEFLIAHFTPNVLWEMEMVAESVKALQLYASMIRFDTALAEKQSKAGEFSWLHTPVLVFDLNTGIAAGASGGHNLKVNTEKLVTSSNVLRGSVQRNPDGTWAVHPNDYSSVKFLGRSREPFISKVPPEKISMSSKLALTEPTEFWNTSFWRGHARVELTTAEKVLVQDLKTLQPDALAVIRRNDGTFVVDNGKIATIKNTHRELIDGVQDLAGGRSTYDVVTLGFNPKEMNGLVTSLAARRGPPGKTGRFSNGQNGERANLLKILDEQPFHRTIDANSARIVKFDAKNSFLQGEVTYLARGIQGRAERVGFWANVNNKIVKAAYWSIEKFTRWFKISAQNANSAKDIKVGVTRLLKQDLEKTFPNHNFDDVNIKIYAEDHLRDYYITEIKLESTHKSTQSS